MAALGIGGSLAALYARRSEPPRGAASPILGPLEEDPKGVVDLPAGFSYRILQQSGEPMSDGFRVPGKPDGMGCFAGPDGTLVLMRNHELMPGMGPAGYDEPPPEAYDRMAPGGVSRLVLRGNDLSVVSSNLVLTGTDRNCAGGHSPWGWLTCEESDAPGHGYVFVCPTHAAKVQNPQRVVGYGRCRHEAAVVVPGSHVAYLTEDRPDGCLYRFVPSSPDRPFEGQLFAMRVAGAPRYDTSAMATPGATKSIDWVPIDNPDPDEDTLRVEARDKGAARVRRGEGIFLDEGIVYVCATTGGPKGAGQVFALDPAAGTLRLVAASTDRLTLDHPDNLCVAPWGDVIVAEDGPDGNFLRGITRDGRVYDLARNARSGSEVTGVCFAPASGGLRSRLALFFNVQHDGLTVAVTGPFPSSAT
jgi:hypothetical protein